MLEQRLGALEASESELDAMLTEMEEHMGPSNKSELSVKLADLGRFVGATEAILGKLEVAVATSPNAGNQKTTDDLDGWAEEFAVNSKVICTRHRSIVVADRILVQRQDKDKKFPKLTDDQHNELQMVMGREASLKQKLAEAEFREKLLQKKNAEYVATISGYGNLINQQRVCLRLPYK